MFKWMVLFVQMASIICLDCQYYPFMTYMYILDDILDCQYYPFMTYILDSILVPGAFRSITMEAFIMGRSFVHGLQEHFRNKYSDPSCLENMIAQELEVSHNIGRAWLWGKPVATVASMIPPTLLLVNIKPDITVIDLGINDIIGDL